MKKTIGIMGSKEKNIASSILNKILKNSQYRTRTMSSEDLGKDINLFKRYIEKMKDIDVFIIEIDKKHIETIVESKIELDIIIDIDMTLDRYREYGYLDEKIELIHTLKSNKLLIINTDDKSSVKLACENKEAIVMTYGLNEKNSLTASSLDFGVKTKFNLCLQRTIETSCNKYIEPFEYPMEVNLIGIENLYSVLAAISVALYLYIDLEVIAKTLLDINVLKRNIKKIHEGNLTIIDSFTETPSDYENVLYNIQNLDYKKLIMMNSIKGSEDNTEKEVADIIKAWSQGVNLKSLVTVVDISNINKTDYYKKIAKKDINYSVCCEVERGIEDCLLKAEKGDMLLILDSTKTNLT